MHATWSVYQFRTLRLRPQVPLWLGLVLGFVLVGCAPLPPPTMSSTTAPAQLAPAGESRGWLSQPQKKSIVVVGDGNTRVQANMAQVTFSIEVVDESVLTAHRVASDTMQSIIDTLAGLDIAATDIKPNSYNVWAERYYPGYVREDPGTVPLLPDPNNDTLRISDSQHIDEIRYRVIHQIYVLVRDPEMITEVVDALVETGGANFYLYGVDYLIDDPAGLEHAAKEKAVADAQRKAKEIARLIGAELGQVVAISELVQGAYGASEVFSPSLWPGQLQFYKQLQIEYAITERAAITPSNAISTAPPSPSAELPESETVKAATESAEVTIHGGDEDALAEFLRQFFVQTFTPIEVSHTDIYIGALPPDLPFSLQLSPTLTVAGTIVTTGDYANSHILLTVEGDVSEHLAELRQQLGQQGFVAPASVSHGVFVTEAPDHISLCSQDGSLALSLSGRNFGDGSGALRIYANVVTAFGGLCGQSGESGRDPFDALLPTLTAPVEIGVYSSGGGGSSDGSSYETTIHFIGDTTIAELAEHYFAQLEAHGWELLDSSQTDDMAWSGWSFRAESQSYNAVFFIVRDAGSDNRFQTTLRLEQVR